MSTKIEFRSLAVPKDLYDWLDNREPSKTKPIWKKLQSLRWLVETQYESQG